MATTGNISPSTSPSVGDATAPDSDGETHVVSDKSSPSPVPARGISLRSPSQTDMFFKTRTVSEADALIKARTQSQADNFLRALAPDASFLKAPDSFDVELGPRKSSVGSYLRGSLNNLLQEELEYMGEEVQELHEDVEIQKPIVPEDWEKDEVCREWAKEPFVMPDDDRIFRIRDAQRRRQKKERKEQAEWSVREKTTFASRMGAAVGSEKLRVILRELEKEWENMLLRLNKKLPKPVLQTMYYHRDDETVLEFVAKKREIFLVQMTLDTRRAEIRKLQDQIFQREEALKKSEALLEEDSLQFDSFLKQNDAAVQEAVKIAEQETKRRQDKIVEIKKLNSAIAAINSDLNKFGEQLDDCKKYKDFLIKLTPKEWLEEQAKMKQQAQESEKLAKARQLLKSAGDSSTGSDRSKFHGDLDAANSSPVDEIDDEVEVEETMYFQQPHQLLEIFSDLEVENLALMQQSQDIEGALENLKTKLRDTEAKSDSRIVGLRSQLQACDANLIYQALNGPLSSCMRTQFYHLQWKGGDIETSAHRDITSVLQPPASHALEKTCMKIPRLVTKQTIDIAVRSEIERQLLMQSKTTLNIEDKKHDISLEQLMRKVVMVYAKVGLDSDASLSSLQLLTNLEAKLEENLIGIDHIPDEYVEQQERIREKERRLKERQQKLELLRQEHETRRLRSLERARAPIFKRVGKPPMYRVNLVKKKRRPKIDASGIDEEVELAEFLEREY